MYLKRKGIFIIDCYYEYHCARCVSPALSHPLRPTLSYPSAPCPLLHFSCRWYIYTCTCIHDLRIMYTYIYLYIYTYAYNRGDTRKRKKKYDARYIYIYICTRAFSDKKGLPTVNHAKFFAQFIRVADTKYEMRFLLMRVANYHLIRE